MERIIKENPDRAQEGIKESDIQFIKPQSEMMKGLFDDQTAILDKEAGIIRLEEQLEESASTV